MKIGFKGMSLVEITIAGALAVGIGLAVTKMSVNTNQNVKLSERNLEIVTLLGEMRALLATPLACKKSLDGMDATSTIGITQILNDNGDVVFEAGKQYGSSGVKIDAIILDSSHDDVTVVANDQGSTNLIVTFDRKSKVPGVKLIEKKIRLLVNTININDIDTCNAFSAGESSIWTRNGTDPNNIFYNDGKVGIGTIAPTLPGILFEVQGASSFYGMGNYALGWGDTTTAGRLTFNANGALIMTAGPADDLTLGTNGGGTDQLVLDSNGNVIIGGNGKVGIGTVAPTQPGIKFEVQGPSSFYGMGQYSLGWGDTATVGRLDYNSDGAVIMTTGTNSLILGTNGGGSDQLKLHTNGNVYIGGNGNVGIGMSTASQKLDVNGNIAIAGVTVHTSDIRLKKDINNIERSLEKIVSLKGIEYFWINREKDSHKQIGLIAQNVQKVFPELVYKNSQTGFLSVNYSGLVAPLIEATKTQQKEIVRLKKEMKLIKEILCSKFSNLSVCP